MPPEPKAKLKRRSSRRELESEFKFDGGHARELELKRSRGEVSCAECRRLKIKCDKQIPCTSCQRRGCAALCPNGSLATGQGTRFVLAATEHLHRRISKLSGRIRELEDALATLHSKHSTQPHPLLTGESIVEDVGEEGENEAVEGRLKTKVTEDDDTEVVNAGGEVIDTFGTLSISDHGISRFFGPTGGSESLLMATPCPSEKNNLPIKSHSQSVQRNSASPIGNGRDASSLSPTLTSNSHFSSNSTTTSFLSAVAADADSQLSATFALFSRTFPFTPLGLPLSEIQSLIKSYLPPYETAIQLIKVFFDQVSWLFQGLTKDQVEEDMIPSIYRRRRAEDHERDCPDIKMQTASCSNCEEIPPLHSEEERTGPHDLALLFIVFAIGALVNSDDKDTGVSVNNRQEECEMKSRQGSDEFKSPKHTIPPIVEHYHQLCRAALSLQPVLEKPSIVSIQALHLLSIYNALSGDGDDRLGKGETGMEMTWNLLTLTSHLSMSIGLHRDSARWGLSPKMVQRRRVVFWDLFVADVWTSLHTGRPPAFSLAYIDCNFPEYVNDTTKGQGEAGNDQFGIWQFRFAAECVAEISARTLTAETPTYATIMELDKKVRGFPLPDVLVDRDPNRRSTDDDMVLSFQICYIEHVKEAMLIYIHRSFFAQAIIDQPINPLKSTYAPSFLAAYRASGTLLKSVREQFATWPNTAGRYWSMWTFAFSAAVVFGTVVTRGPRSPLAQSAMIELDQACILFSKAAAYSLRASRALPILTKLREKAQCALVSVRNETSPMSGENGGLLWNIKNEDSADELSIFAGHTRLISARQKSTSKESSPTVDSPPVEMGQPPGQIRIEPQRHSNRHDTSSAVQVQGRGLYGEDIAMELDPYDSPDSRSSTYSIPRPRDPYPPAEQSQLPLSQVANLGAHPDHGVSPSSALSPVNGGWRDDEGARLHQMEYSIRRSNLSQTYTEPTTISIPPATPPPTNASHARQIRQSHQPIPLVYSYDRSRPNPSNEYSWSSQGHPYTPSESSPIRLSHPQYIQDHMYRPSQEIYATTGPGMDSYHGYHSQSHTSQHVPHQAGPGPGPGNAALAGLGLAARDSRLDERWSSFMQDSGLLDDVNNYRSR
ncbi:hypothetical protein E1B28_007310 [Marasmius oreades]|uniref:Zn(2)-C6 fungal-type domain-containing protein n=1 Tax=Marasmius oreades TaxID=181124 RepID=A0A9P7UTM8_9AGAR|nr:uncharacterized protein E1B28_007310 [Marasmius oreades]KAG7093648.1 hypothetical protein E1B28_007310 [Marasmius oreades]